MLRETLTEASSQTIGRFLQSRHGDSLETDLEAGGSAHQPELANITGEVEECRRAIDELTTDKMRLIATVQELTQALSLTDSKDAQRQGEFDALVAGQQRMKEEVKKLSEALAKTPAAEVATDIGSSGLPRPPGGELVGVGLAILQVYMCYFVPLCEYQAYGSFVSI